MVERGFEARVGMVLNDNMVMSMYDKDYSGSNERYTLIYFAGILKTCFRLAMIGQSIIVEMNVGYT